MQFQEKCYAVRERIFRVIANVHFLNSVFFLQRPQKSAWWTEVMSLITKPATILGVSSSQATMIATGAWMED